MNAPVPAKRSTPAQLVDRFGRIHRSLRISVTDVCNIRCQYCMPDGAVTFAPVHQQLSFKEISAFTKIVSNFGIQKVRLTGGEPLLRRNLHELVAQLSEIRPLQEIALTTNGMLLAKQVDQLVASGLQRVNVSLDTLSEKTFRTLARRDGLDQVLEGIEAARRCPQLKLKLNALVLRDINLGDVVELVSFARAQQLELRFIEFMPLDAEREWAQQRVVSGAELRSVIQREIAPLVPIARSNPSQPARDFQFSDQPACRIGFIDSVTNPFCSACDRLRLTADGKLRNCLFGTEEWDLLPLLRTKSVSESQLLEQVKAALDAKHASHGIADEDFEPPQRAMYQIGG